MNDTNIVIPTRMMQAFNNGCRLVGFDSRNCTLAVAVPIVVRYRSNGLPQDDLACFSTRTVGEFISQIHYGENFNSFFHLVPKFRCYRFTPAGSILTFIIHHLGESKHDSNKITIEV